MVTIEIMIRTKPERTSSPVFPNPYKYPESIFFKYALFSRAEILCHIIDPIMSLIPPTTRKIPPIRKNPKPKVSNEKVSLFKIK